MLLLREIFVKFYEKLSLSGGMNETVYLVV